MEDYLQNVREGCTPAQWSRGVKWAREGKVQAVRVRGDEIDVRVESFPGLPANSVVLEPEIGSWDCDCDARTDACDHVAAAVIVYEQARKQGKPMPGLEAAAADQPLRAHVGYRLRSRKGPLRLRRVLVTPEGEKLMPASLAKLEARKVPDAPRVSADKADRAWEKRFGPAVKAKLPPRLMADILEFLSRATDVQLDGRPIEIGDPAPGLILRVTETKTGAFLARIEQDPEINELFENGAFRKKRKLHAVGPHNLSPQVFEELRRGLVFEARDAGPFVAQTLPEVRKHLPVSIDTPRLPGSAKMRPRIELSSARQGDAIQILATLVYGEPAVARVDGDRLRLLAPPKQKGKKKGKTRAKPDAPRAIPVRNLRAESVLRDRLRERFDLELGVRKTLGATEAIALGRALEADERDVQLADEGLGAFFEVAALEPKLVVSDDGDFELYFVPEGMGDLSPEALAAAAKDEGEDEFGSLDDDLHPLDARARLGLGFGKRGRVRRADAAAVLRAWRAGEGFAPLLDGGFGQIPSDFLNRHGHLVSDLLAAREAQAELSTQNAKVSVLDLAELAQALDQAPPPGFDRLAALVGDFEGIPSAPLPEDLDAELREYQVRGVNWLHFLRDAELGALLADDMGLGKTLQTLCVLRAGKRALVVSPTSVLHNWRSEIERFRPGLRAHVFHGPKRQLDDEADVLLTTYAILRRDIDRLSQIRWDTVVLDEAQAIKNPTSKVARASYRLQADFKIALTGTPVENHLEDLWSQFHYLQPGLLGGRTQFGDRYVKPIGVGDNQAAKRLRRRIRPFVLRRLKREVATELPPRTDVVLRCELDASERRTYDAVRAATQEQVVEQLSSGNNVLQVLEALLRLRQAACHRALLPGGSGRIEKDGGDPNAPSSKLQLLLDTLVQVVDTGHKALVFSQWTTLLDLVEPALKDAGLDFCRLDGSTRDRGGVVERFQDPAGPPVMIISLKAGGTGLNLTAADNVFLLDPWWNPAVEDQAADRAHRIGQDKPVIVHRLIASETVEERILALQDRKRKLAETAVGDASGAHAITRDELMALLE
ncbi:SNF2/helicase domain protein [Plesiocystis pacifica SIR-1]|uniref:SNF2/helicase domain protein n=1 Tax=Plesiocystis pacifica SIR-1 TaxID=391625 RepID=A6G647_9BACT|nr:DEAD/DEAH box helicase [Plesiocystis pacifica]EDM78649.1 SNF2/helicase domain protein [Plesiocystis pacifica SIR-1]